MTGWLRKLGIFLHVVLSVGWLGAVAAFLALALAALRSDQALSRAAFVGMDLIGRWVLVPLSLGALASGIVQSIGTRWGLVRHYWVLVKLLLTIAATAVFLLHQFTVVEEAARVAMQTTAGASEPLRRFGIQSLADAGVAAVVLTTITAIAVYKPWGLTPFAKDAPAVRAPGADRRSLRLLVGILIALLTAFVTLHLSGRSLHHSQGH